MGFLNNDEMIQVCRRRLEDLKAKNERSDSDLRDMDDTREQLRAALSCKQARLEEELGWVISELASL